MRFLAAFCFILIFGCTNVHAQKQPCNSDILLKTSKSFTSLYDIDIRHFLLSFKGNCDKDESARDWRNELLFEILDRYPDTVIKILATYRGLPIKIILEELKSPIATDIDFEKLITKVEDVKFDYPVKKQVLESLAGASK
jgi:hypothetical protein